MLFCKCLCYIFLNLIFILNCQSNFTKSNNESETFEISSCENFSTSCYPSSSEPTTEISFISTDKNTLPNTKKTTIFETAPSPTPEVKKETKKTEEKHCHCDIIPGICDVNCCCDNNCNKWERAAFSTCLQTIQGSSYGQCVSTDVIYKNNTPYPTTRSVSGLLCISKDNFPERNTFIDQQVIDSIQVFEKVWKRKKHFSWPTIGQQPYKKIEKTEIYKYGDPLWKYINSTNEAINIYFPALMTSNICQMKKSVFYLKNFSSKCLQRIPLYENECTENYDLNANSFCQDLILITSPSLINSSVSLNESPEDAFIKVKQILCQDGTCSETIQYPQPVFDDQSKSCRNIVRNVHMILRHNGSVGITEATCTISLDNQQRSTEKWMFEQSFIVDFISANLLNSTVYFKRSGTPGYRTGLPVITQLLKHGEKIKSNLTVLSGKGCLENTPVLFKENMRIQCTLTIPVKSSQNCSWLEEQIINKLLQGIGEVGVTGDPDSWLESPHPLITTATSPGFICSPVTTLSLHFIYSYRGSLMNPEAKIIGLLSKLGSHQTPKCSQSFCTLRLVTIVSFTDVSRPVVSKYASAPVVKIKLPQDFFYPFSSSTISVIVSAQKLFVVVFFVAFLNL